MTETADRLVVDASAIAAIVFDEPEGVAILGRLGASQLFAPQLLPFELGNVGAKKLRLKPEQRGILEQALVEFTEMPIGLHEIDLVAVVALAGETKLSAYDASYLWLARELDAELVTLDKELQDAADKSKRDT
jgi:predicted nucleic acid-binding protein